MLAVAWRVVVTAISLAGCRQVLGIEDTEVVELGAICTGVSGGNRALCPPAAPECLSFDGRTYFCTATCGTSPAGPNPVPPLGGLAFCQRLASSGSPTCGAPDTSNPTEVTWYCAIYCGTTGGQDLGSCPPGLRCTDNYCK